MGAGGRLRPGLRPRPGKALWRPPCRSLLGSLHLLAARRQLCSEPALAPGRWCPLPQAKAKGKKGEAGGRGKGAAEAPRLDYSKSAAVFAKIQEQRDGGGGKGGAAAAAAGDAGPPAARYKL